MHTIMNTKKRGRKRERERERERVGNSKNATG